NCESGCRKWRFDGTRATYRAVYRATHLLAQHSPLVVARSPDRVTSADRRSQGIPGDLRSAEWSGQETRPQQKLAMAMRSLGRSRAGVGRGNTGRSVAIRARAALVWLLANESAERIAMR